MTIHSINSVKDASSLGLGSGDAGERISTLSYYPPVFPSTEFIGGRVYVWDPDRPTADHDGGTVISLTCPWDGTRANLEDFLDGVGETDPTGNGCMVLQDPSEVFVEDYGAKGNDLEDANTVDDYPSIHAAITRVLWQDGPTKIFSGRVKLRSTQYYVSQTLNLKSEVTFEGMGHSSVLRFDGDTTGIIANRDDTLNDTTVSPETGDSAGSVLRNFTVDSNYGSDTSKHGIWMRRAIKIEGVKATRFAGHGIAIIATAVTQDQSRVGNANGWFMLNIQCSLNKRHGVYVDGADVNAGWGIGINCNKNEGVGIYDSSFLGNTWVGCHVATNDEGSYEADNPSARSIFLGCYSEGGRPASNLQTPSMAIGGIHAAGLNGYFMDGDDLTIRDVIAKRQIICDLGGGGAEDHIVARNPSSLSSSYEAQFSGYSGVKADDSGHRPAGCIFMRPTSGNPDRVTQLGFRTYSGEVADEMVDVAYFWGNTDFSPSADNTTDLGYSANQWKDIYLVNSPTVSSDARFKQDVADLTTAEYAVATRLRGLVKTYRLKASVAEKGGAARKHVGVMAQDVIQAFADEGLEAFGYGIVGEGRGPDNVGERYHVRYEELLAFMIAAL